MCDEIRDRSKDFCELIKILYAVVLGQGLIDLSINLELPSKTTNFLTLQTWMFVGTMYLTIRDWTTYHEGIREHPHRGPIRFLLDIAILLCFFFLIRIAASKPPLNSDHVRMFLSICMLYFGATLLWEFFCAREYRDDRQGFSSACKECAWCAVYLLLFGVGLGLVCWKIGNEELIAVSVLAAFAILTVAKGDFGRIFFRPAR
jgi:hypothetical protein